MNVQDYNIVTNGDNMTDGEYFDEYDDMSDAQVEALYDAYLHRDPSEFQDPTEDFLLVQAAHNGQLVAYRVA